MLMYWGVYVGLIPSENTGLWRPAIYISIRSPSTDSFGLPSKWVIARDLDLHILTIIGRA